MGNDRTRWNEKHDDEEFQLPDEPIPELSRRIESLPAGRALDVATGTGRNALFLADHGYDVDAIDISDRALEKAQQRARERDLEDAINWTRGDIAEMEFEPAIYDVVTISFFAALELLPDIKETLAPDGVLVYEHHLRSREPVDIGPSSSRHRFRSNDLLRACLDLTVLAYREGIRVEDGRRSAVATIVARNSHGGTQSFPVVSEWDTGME